MKKFLSIILTALLAWAGNAKAANTLSVADVTVTQGTQATVTVDYSLDGDYTGFQFEVGGLAANGISVVTQGENDIVFTQGDCFSADHSIVTNYKDGIGSFVCLSMGSSSLTKRSGTLLSFKISVPEAVAAGEYTGRLTGIKFVPADGGESVESDDVSFKIKVQEPKVTITAKSYTRVYGDANPVFEYTSEGAALKGSPAITCEATATSPVGTYDIVVSKGNLTNGNVEYVKGTLTITKAPLTIAAGTYTKKQGETNPEFALTYSGFKNKETESVLTKKPSVSCSAVASSAPGEYPVTISGAEAQNYEITYQNGKLIVTEADAVVVTAKNYTRAYGDANPTFEFTSEGAALDGTPTITCEATATSPVGTYDILVAQGSVKNYNVTYVKGTLTITKAPLTISAGTYTKKQGEANPEFALTYTGFKNNETEAVLSKMPTVSCEAVASSAPGEYPVTVSGAEAQNYEITYQNGKLIVTEADAVVVTAKSYTRVYGDANPTFEFTSEGAALDGTPTISCEATATSPVGTYDILVAQGSVKNYNVTYVKGTLTITKAPLTIAAGTYTKKQGEANPEFALTYTGFKNKETESVLSKMPTVSCEAVASSAPGEYPVTVSGAEAQNYEITYQNGKLIVTEADAVVVTAKSYTRVYGDANPTFEFTSEGAALDGTPTISCEATASSPVGTYDIVVAQGSVNNYNVTYVKGTLTITKAPLMIAAGTYTKKQGEANPEFALTYTGFKNNETESILTKKPSVSCSAVASSAPGEYPVTVSGAEAQNYEITYQNGKLIVTEADAVVVKAKSYTRAYGDANPTFEFTTEGAALDGTPTISCEATATSPVGTYDIVVAQGSVTNYNVTYVKGTLTITKAPLTIAAGTYTKKQGEANPEFALIYTGFKNNETESILTKKPSVSCFAVASSAPGEYPVTVSGAEAQNYEITYKNGKLIVTEADAVVVTAKSYTRVYGDANPTFEFTSEGAALDGTPVITCDATATSPVGTYDIIVAQGSVKNYNVTYVKGTLTITKAPLTISAGIYTKKQGEANPEFDLTYTGFKNNEDESVLTTKPTATCEATELSEPGEYIVTVSGAEAQNYEIAYVAGTLTIIEDPNKFTEEDGTEYVIQEDASVSIQGDGEVTGSYEVPSTVTHDGQTYQVTAIGESAFEGNTELTEVTIPASISEIGKDAFKDCVNLKQIVIYATTPIDITSSSEGTRSEIPNPVFEGVDLETCILYVPDESVDAYKSAEGWRDFKHILPISILGIHSVKVQESKMDVYTIDGIKILSGVSTIEGLNSGWYIVRTIDGGSQKNVRKVVVR